MSQTISTIILGSLFVAMLGVQSFWISHSLDALRGEVRQFKDQTHGDLQTHTNAVADLRDRVTRLEKDA